MNNTFTFKCSDEEQKLLVEELSNPKYERTNVPHTIISIRSYSLIINLYKSGKL